MLLIRLCPWRATRGRGAVPGATASGNRFILNNSIPHKNITGESGEQMGKESGVIAAAITTSAAYAAWLHGDTGRRWAVQWTWTTVVFGCGYTLLYLWMMDREAARKATWMFIATGTPIIVGSLIKKDQDISGAVNRTGK